MVTPDQRWLDQMDEERYEDPQGALGQLLSRAEEVPLLLHAQFLGVCGSAFRNRAVLCGAAVDLAAAMDCLVMGKYVAWCREDNLATANLMIRETYIHDSRGEYARALQLAEKANAMGDRLQNRTIRGRSLAEQGRSLFHLGRYSDAFQCYTASVDVLPNSERRYRCSAYHALGHCSVAIGDLPSALGYAKLAEPLVPESRPFLTKLRWFQGELCAELGQYSEALGILTDVVENLHTLHIGETVLACCDLMKVQLQMGLAEEAWQTAESAIGIMTAAIRNRTVSAALAELLRGGQSALDLNRVSNVKRQVERAREHRTWRSLAASQPPGSINGLAPARIPVRTRKLFE